jgi:hypothetical protein
MKIEIIKCDICKADDALTCSFYVDRRMDPAGSMDDEYEYIDLCPKHQWRAYKLAEQLLTSDQVDTVVSALRSGLTKVYKPSPITIPAKESSGK